MRRCKRPRPCAFRRTYALVTVNGLPLPASLQPPEPNPRITVISGTFVLAPNGRYTFSNTWDETLAGVTTRRASSCAGSWTNSSVTFTFVETQTADCGDIYTVTWDGNDRLTIALAPEIEAVLER